MESHTDSDAKALPASSDNPPHHRDSSFSSSSSSHSDNRSNDEGSSSMKRQGEREQITETNGQCMEGSQNIEDSPTAEIIKAKNQLAEMSGQHIEMNNRLTEMSGQHIEMNNQCIDRTQSIETGSPLDSYTMEINKTSGQHTETNGRHIEQNGQHTETNDQQILNIIDTTFGTMDFSDVGRISYRPNEKMDLSKEIRQEKGFTKISEIEEEYHENAKGSLICGPAVLLYPGGTYLKQVYNGMEGTISGGNNLTGGAPIQSDQSVDLLPILCSVVFPNYPWGMCSSSEQNQGAISGGNNRTGGAPILQKPPPRSSSEWDLLPGLCSMAFPNYPWGMWYKSDQNPGIRELPGFNDPSKRPESIERNDVIKSIVYGGLNISIGSFGVISSAAGGKATTCTIVYMGFATLLTGLVMFFHTVVNLFHGNKIQYRELVGKTLGFNGTIALVSYLFFGMLAPLVYALVFWDSDDRDYKFFASAAISLVSVVLLSTGKAYVYRKPYRSTVSAYAVSGVLSSVVGYVTGHFLTELLEKWGL